MDFDLQLGSACCSYGDQKEEALEDVKEEACSLNNDQISSLLAMEYQRYVHEGGHELLFPTHINFNNDDIHLGTKYDACTFVSPSTNEQDNLKDNSAYEELLILLSIHGILIKMMFLVITLI